MSRKDDRSALDAIIDENMSARDRTDAPASSEGEDEGFATEAGPAGNGADAPPSLGGADAVSELDSLIAERDSYLADSQRLAADFANYRKQSDKRVAETAAAQSAGLVRNLLPVIDACDSALEQDPDSAVGPIRTALLGELDKSGLELLAPSEGSAFDPELHEAVMHESPPDDEGDGGPTIAEVFRAGYVWKGKVLRPAMVKVVG